ncbi:MAG: hypothetical protein VB934_18725 [Polyangiaceae bacterium]
MTTSGGYQIPRGALYHGTFWRRSVQGIVTHGFEGDRGSLGTGVYLTCDWKVAAQFGRWLLRVGLTPGTRVLDTSRPPDRNVLNHLRREFGQELLKAPDPLRVLPRNKRLTGIELKALVSYHHQREIKTWMRRRAWDIKLMESLRRLTHRYGYHAIGVAESILGLIVFEPERIRVKELVFAPLRKGTAKGVRPVHEWKTPDLATLRAAFARSGRDRDLSIARTIELAGRD